MPVPTQPSGHRSDDPERQWADYITATSRTGAQCTHRDGTIRPQHPIDGDIRDLDRKLTRGVRGVAWGVAIVLGLVLLLLLLVAMSGYGARSY